MSSYFEPSVIQTGSSGPITIQPDLADAIVVTAGVGVWAYGAWSTIVAAAVLASHALVGVQMRSGSGAAIQLQVQVGTGTAGSEVALAALPFFQESNAGEKLTLMLPIPLVIPANARVAARCADGTGGGLTQVVKLLFMPRPIV